MLLPHDTILEGDIISVQHVGDMLLQVYLSRVDDNGVTQVWKDEDISHIEWYIGSKLIDTYPLNMPHVAPTYSQSNTAMSQMFCPIHFSYPIPIVCLQFEKMYFRVRFARGTTRRYMCHMLFDILTPEQRETIALKPYTMHIEQHHTVVPNQLYIHAPIKYIISSEFKMTTYDDFTLFVNGQKTSDPIVQMYYSPYIYPAQIKDITYPRTNDTISVTSNTSASTPPGVWRSKRTLTNPVRFEMSASSNSTFAYTSTTDTGWVSDQYTFGSARTYSISPSGAYTSTTDAGWATASRVYGNATTITANVIVGSNPDTQDGVMSSVSTWTASTLYLSDRQGDYNVSVSSGNLYAPNTWSSSNAFGLKLSDGDYSITPSTAWTVLDDSTVTSWTTADAFGQDKYTIQLTANNASSNSGVEFFPSKLFDTNDRSGWKSNNSANVYGYSSIAGVYSVESSNNSSTAYNAFNDVGWVSTPDAFTAQQTIVTGMSVNAFSNVGNAWYACDYNDSTAWISNTIQYGKTIPVETLTTTSNTITPTLWISTGNIFGSNANGYSVLTATSNTGNVANALAWTNAVSWISDSTFGQVIVPSGGYTYSPASLSQFSNTTVQIATTAYNSAEKWQNTTAYFFSSPIPGRYECSVSDAFNTSMTTERPVQILLPSGEATKSRSSIGGSFSLGTTATVMGTTAKIFNKFPSDQAITDADTQTLLSTNTFTWNGVFDVSNGKVNGTPQLRIRGFTSSSIGNIWFRVFSDDTGTSALDSRALTWAKSSGNDDSNTMTISNSTFIAQGKYDTTNPMPFTVSTFFVPATQQTTTVNYTVVCDTGTGTPITMYDIPNLLAARSVGAYIKVPSRLSFSPTTSLTLSSSSLIRDSWTEFITTTTTTNQSAGTIQFGHVSSAVTNEPGTRIQVYVNPPLADTTVQDTNGLAYVRYIPYKTSTSFSGAVLRYPLIYFGSPPSGALTIGNGKYIVGYNTPTVSLTVPDREDTSSYGFVYNSTAVPGVILVENTSRPTVDTVSGHPYIPQPLPYEKCVYKTNAQFRVEYIRIADNTTQFIFPDITMLTDRLQNTLIGSSNQPTMNFYSVRGVENPPNDVLNALKFIGKYVFRAFSTPSSGAPTTSRIIPVFEQQLDLQLFKVRVYIANVDGTYSELTSGNNAYSDIIWFNAQPFNGINQLGSLCNIQDAINGNVGYDLHGHLTKWNAQLLLTDMTEFDKIASMTAFPVIPHDNMYPPPTNFISTPITWKVSSGTVISSSGTVSSFTDMNTIITFTGNYTNKGDYLDFTFIKNCSETDKGTFINNVTTALFSNGYDLRTEPSQSDDNIYVKIIYPNSDAVRQNIQYLFRDFGVRFRLSTSTGGLQELYPSGLRINDWNGSRLATVINGSSVVPYIVTIRGRVMRQGVGYSNPTSVENIYAYYTSPSTILYSFTGTTSITTVTVNTNNPVSLFTYTFSTTGTTLYCATFPFYSIFYYDKLFITTDTRIPPSLYTSTPIGHMFLNHDARATDYNKPVTVSPTSTARQPILQYITYNEGGIATTTTTTPYAFYFIVNIIVFTSTYEYQIDIAPAVPRFSHNITYGTADTTKTLFRVGYYYDATTNGVLNAWSSPTISVGNHITVQANGKSYYIFALYDRTTVTLLNFRNIFPSGTTLTTSGLSASSISFRFSTTTSTPTPSIITVGPATGVTDATVAHVNKIRFFGLTVNNRSGPNLVIKIGTVDITRLSGINFSQIPFQASDNFALQNLAGQAGAQSGLDNRTFNYQIEITNDSTANQSISKIEFVDVNNVVIQTIYPLSPSDYASSNSSTISRGFKTWMSNVDVRMSLSVSAPNDFYKVTFNPSGIATGVVNVSQNKRLESVELDGRFCNVNAGYTIYSNVVVSSATPGQLGTSFPDTSIPNSNVVTCSLESLRYIPSGQQSCQYSLAAYSPLTISFGFPRPMTVSRLFIGSSYTSGISIFNDSSTTALSVTRTNNVYTLSSTQTLTTLRIVPNSPSAATVFTLSNIAVSNGYARISPSIPGTLMNVFSNGVTLTSSSLTIPGYSFTSDDPRRSLITNFNGQTVTFTTNVHANALVSGGTRKIQDIPIVYGDGALTGASSITVNGASGTSVVPNLGTVKEYAVSFTISNFDPTKNGIIFNSNALTANIFEGGLGAASTTIVLPAGTTTKYGGIECDLPVTEYRVEANATTTGTVFGLAPIGSSNLQYKFTITQSNVFRPSTYFRLRNITGTELYKDTGTDPTCGLYPVGKYTLTGAPPALFSRRGTAAVSGPVTLTFPQSVTVSYIYTDTLISVVGSTGSSTTIPVGGGPLSTPISSRTFTFTAATGADGMTRILLFAPNGNITPKLEQSIGGTDYWVSNTISSNILTSASTFGWTFPTANVTGYTITAPTGKYLPYRMNIVSGSTMLDVWRNVSEVSTYTGTFPYPRQLSSLQCSVNELLETSTIDCSLSLILYSCTFTTGSTISAHIYGVPTLPYTVYGFSNIGNNTISNVTDAGTDTVTFDFGSNAVNISNITYSSLVTSLSTPGLLYSNALTSTLSVVGVIDVPGTYTGSMVYPVNGGMLDSVPLSTTKQSISIVKIDTRTLTVNGDSDVYPFSNVAHEIGTGTLTISPIESCTFRFGGHIYAIRLNGRNITEVIRAMNTTQAGIRITAATAGTVLFSGVQYNGVAFTFTEALSQLIFFGRGIVTSSTSITGWTVWFRMNGTTITGVYNQPISSLSNPAANSINDLIAAPLLPYSNVFGVACTRTGKCHYSNITLYNSLGAALNTGDVRGSGTQSFTFTPAYPVSFKSYSFVASGVISWMLKSGSTVVDSVLTNTNTYVYRTLTAVTQATSVTLEVSNAVGYAQVSDFKLYSDTYRILTSNALVSQQPVSYGSSLTGSYGLSASRVLGAYTGLSLGMGQLNYTLVSGSEYIFGVWIQIVTPIPISVKTVYLYGNHREYTLVQSSDGGASWIRMMSDGNADVYRECTQNLPEARHFRFICKTTYSSMVSVDIALCDALGQRLNSKMADGYLTVPVHFGGACASPPTIQYTVPRAVTNIALYNTNISNISINGTLTKMTVNASGYRQFTPSVPIPAGSVTVSVNGIDGGRNAELYGIQLLDSTHTPMVYTGNTMVSTVPQGYYEFSGTTVTFPIQVQAKYKVSSIGAVTSMSPEKTFTLLSGEVLYDTNYNRLNPISTSNGYITDIFYSGSNAVGYAQYIEFNANETKISNSYSFTCIPPPIQWTLTGDGGLSTTVTQNWKPDSVYTVLIPDGWNSQKYRLTIDAIQSSTSNTLSISTFGVYKDTGALHVPECTSNTESASRAYGTNLNGYYEYPPGLDAFVFNGGSTTASVITIRLPCFVRLGGYTLSWTPSTAPIEFQTSTDGGATWTTTPSFPTPPVSYIRIENQTGATLSGFGLQSFNNTFII